MHTRTHTHKPTKIEIKTNKQKIIRTKMYKQNKLRQKAYKHATEFILCGPIIPDSGPTLKCDEYTQ